MTDSKGRIDEAKDKTVGGVKEAVGKVTGNEELEFYVFTIIERRKK